MSEVEAQIAEYEWHFAHLLNVPPYLLEQLTADQFERGRAYVDALMKRKESS